MTLSLMPVQQQREIADLLNNWADTPASGHCFHCYRFSPGASKGVPCYDCRDDVQHESEVQAWRDEEAASRACDQDSGYWGNGSSGHSAWEERD